MPESSGHLALTGFISRVEWMMERNLAKISQDEMDKVNVDLAAAGVALRSGTICRWSLI